MRIQDHLIAVTREAADEFFRYARAVPVDRLEWSVLDAGQTVLAMCQEIAKTPEWGLQVLVDRQTTDEERTAAYAEMKSWTTVPECMAQFEKRFAGWSNYVREFNHSDFEKTRWLPFNGGRDHTYLEMLEFPRWNCSYHTGQIAFIQTLYGDKAMY